MSLCDAVACVLLCLGGGVCACVMRWRVCICVRRWRVRLCDAAACVRL